MNDRYFIVYFDNNGADMTLFENKFLNTTQYTRVDDDEYVFTNVVYEEKELNPRVKFLNEKFFYDGYKLIEEPCCSCNDYTKDGFRYDKKNQRVIYGHTPIYTCLVGDSFIDVVTGQVIPRNFVKKFIEINTPERLNAMANDLIKLSKHVDIYSIILSDWISMFSTDLVNMHAVLEIYDELCFKKYREEYGELTLECCDFQEIEESVLDRTALEVGEHQKIKKIIDSIRKSSRS